MNKIEINGWKDSASESLNENRFAIYNGNALVFQVTDKQKEYLEKHTKVIENWCKKQRIQSMRLIPFDISFDGNDCVVNF